MGVVVLERRCSFLCSLVLFSFSSLQKKEHTLRKAESGCGDFVAFAANAASIWSCNIFISGFSRCLQHGIPHKIANVAQVLTCQWALCRKSGRKNLNVFPVSYGLTAGTPAMSKKERRASFLFEDVTSLFICVKPFVFVWVAFSSRSKDQFVCRFLYSSCNWVCVVSVVNILAHNRQIQQMLRFSVSVRASRVSLFFWSFLFIWTFPSQRNLWSTLCAVTCHDQDSFKLFLVFLSFRPLSVLNELVLVLRSKMRNTWNSTWPRRSPGREAKRKRSKLDYVETVFNGTHLNRFVGWTVRLFFSAFGLVFFSATNFMHHCGRNRWLVLFPSFFTFRQKSLFFLRRFLEHSAWACF